MGNRKLGQNIFIVGIAGLILSIIWWMSFYSKVDQAFGGRTTIFTDSQTWKCLIWNSGPCAIVTGLANAAGEFAYQPMIFWISAAAIGVGYLMKNSK